MSPYKSFNNNNKFLFRLIKELIEKKDINWINLRELLYKR